MKMKCSFAPSRSQLMLQTRTPRLTPSIFGILTWFHWRTWRITLNEQIKNNGFTGNYEMVMNLAQAMLAGRSLDAFVKEIRAKEVKNKTRLAKNTTELTPQQIYDYAIFELVMRAFDTQSGWRGAFERQREYMRRYLLMGKLNPEKCSQRLQEMNRYLDFIPMGKSTGTEKPQL
jgi:hypothetical protein